MDKPRIIVFASGGKEGGGSGFEKLVNGSRIGALNANIVAVVSNHARGGVYQRADKLNIPFVHFSPPRTAVEYQRIVEEYQANWISLSGWLKLVEGLDPQTTINIHPAPLPDFGGKGMYGHHVHEAVIAAYKRGEIIHSAVTMHFVTEKYDDGPIFFQLSVSILPEDTPESLGRRVNEMEHLWQSWVTNLVVQGSISWDGKDPKTLKVPAWYRYNKIN